MTDMVATGTLRAILKAVMERERRKKRERAEDMRRKEGEVWAHIAKRDR